MNDGIQSTLTVRVDEDIFNIYVVEESPASIGSSGSDTYIDVNGNLVRRDYSVSMSFMEESCPVVNKDLIRQWAKVGTEVVSDHGGQREKTSSMTIGNWQCLVWHTKDLVGEDIREASVGPVVMRDCGAFNVINDENISSSGKFDNVEIPFDKREKGEKGGTPTSQARNWVTNSTNKQDIAQSEKAHKEVLGLDNSNSEPHRNGGRSVQCEREWKNKKKKKMEEVLNLRLSRRSKGKVRKAAQPKLNQEHSVALPVIREEEAKLEESIHDS
ncbi:hypothetical protein Ancab_029642 [Ancistrocladus abbreviatus]